MEQTAEHLDGVLQINEGKSGKGLQQIPAAWKWSGVAMGWILPYPSTLFLYSLFLLQDLLLGCFKERTFGQMGPLDLTQFGRSLGLRFLFKSLVILEISLLILLRIPPVASLQGQQCPLHLQWEARGKHLAAHVYILGGVPKVQMVCHL